MRYACALAGRRCRREVVGLTRDGRATGRMLAEAVGRGLEAVGPDVIDADVAATPTTGVLVRHHRGRRRHSDFGQPQPAEYNGLKLFSAEGRVIPADRAASDRALPPAAEPAWAQYQQRRPRRRACDDSTSRAPGAGADDGRRRANSPRASFKVLLDSNHGAGSLLGRRLLEELGCHDHDLGGDAGRPVRAHARADGRESGRRALRTCGERRDIGFCQDPDADRLAVIDESGPIPGRGIHAGHVRRSRAAQHAGPDRDELLDQPHDRGPGREIRRAVLSLGRGRGQCRRCDAGGTTRCSAAKEMAA